MLWTWLAAFVTTQLIEAPIWALAQAIDGPPGGGDPGRARLPFGRGSTGRRIPAVLGWLALGLIPSAVTHPVVWFVIPRVVSEPWVAMVLVAEAFAVATEAALAWRWGIERALAWAVLANGASLGLGLLLRA